MLIIAAMDAAYDRIGLNYAALRRPDPRIAAQLHAALGHARTILNVGAGAGSYEPADRAVTAIDPSAAMIAQRPVSDTAVIRGCAEDLPFDDNMFDAGMAVLTLHHWTDIAKGLAQMRRVVRGPIALLTYDPAFRGLWLFDYFPALIALDEAQMPPMNAYAGWLGRVTLAEVPIPHDCTDGFLSAYWRRPAAYLDPQARSAISSFWKIVDVTAGLDRLQRDLDSGAWTQRYGHELSLQSRDCGYRLVVAH